MQIESCPCAPSVRVRVLSVIQWLRMLATGYLLLHLQCAVTSFQSIHEIRRQTLSAETIKKAQ